MAISEPFADLSCALVLLAEARIIECFFKEIYLIIVETCSIDAQIRATCSHLDQGGVKIHRTECIFLFPHVSIFLTGNSFLKNESIGLQSCLYYSEAKLCILSVPVLQKNTCTAD